MNKKEMPGNLFRETKPASPRKVLFRPILMHFAARYSHKTYGQFASDHKILVACNIRAMEDFETDMVGLISDPYRETSAFGAGIEFIDEGVPRCMEQIVDGIDDVRNLKNPDVYKSVRTRDRIDGAALFQKELRGEVPVIGWIEGPLAEACNLAGIDNMLIQMMTDPDFSNLLLDKCLYTAKEFAAAQIEAGCDIIGMGDAICSQIDVPSYKEFVKPRHQEIITSIHARGARVKLHICGDISHLLPEIKDLGVDILDLDYQVSLAEAHNIIGDTVICCGNINPVTIQDKTADEIFNMSRKLIEEEKGKRFILSGGCEITVNTPHANLKAMSQACNIQPWLT